jgi:anti-sigma factor RsiW
MKLTCIKHHRNLAAYVDGELPPDKAARLELHLRSCDCCSADVRELGQLSGLAPPAEIEPSADFDRVFWTRLAEARQEKSPAALSHVFFPAKSFFTSPAGLSLSAGLAMGVFIISLYLMRPVTPAAPPQQQELMAAAELDLYANFEVIQNSEALENFELIEALDELKQDAHG